jgi:PhnB protein
MTQILPSLTFNGQAEQAFDFYRSVFGGEFTSKMRWADNPQCEQFSDADKQLIMHVSLPVGGGAIMGNDTLAAFGGIKEGNNFAVTLIPDTRDEADRLFNGLSAGGEVKMPMQDMFWGAYFGAFADKFGVQWMINCDNK